jgi:hypothetical protein
MQNFIRYFLFYFLLFLSLGFKAAEPRVLKFTIYLFGDSIGSMTITRYFLPDGMERYIIKSASSAKILWVTRDNYSDYEFTYKNGRLLSTTYRETEGGKVTRWGNMKFDGAKYIVNSYRGNFSFTEVPQYSIVSIYFGNMRSARRLYYDTEAEFVKVEHPDDNTVEFKTSDGHRNVYHYVKGELDHLEVHVSIATVKMIRVR